MSQNVLEDVEHSYGIRLMNGKTHSVTKIEITTSSQFKGLCRATRVSPCTICVKRLMANLFGSAMILLGSLQSRQTTLKALNLSISCSDRIHVGVQKD